MTDGRFVLFAKILILAVAALPAIHLIPLPVTMWTALPGRAPALAILAAIGASPAPHPLSLDPAATLAAGLELIPGIAFFWAATRLSPQRQRALLAIVILVALVSALLGAFQRATGAVTIFADAHAPFGPGLFVNRNHQATLLLVAIVLTPAVMGPRRRAAIPIVLLLFAGGIVATTSRAGLALLLPALAIAALLSVERRPRPRDVAIGGVALAVAVAAAWASGAVQLVATRFADGSERYAFWQATLAATRDFWPWGSGIATFDKIFPLYESDALIGPYRIPAAHNDFLQLLLEGGLPALVLIVAGIGLLTAAAHAARRRSLGQAAAAGLAILLIHSALDFPLRMMALSAVFGLLSGILLSAADRRGTAS
ncbi:O-antigen ligase [Sphingomonas jinjuensis]|uniref:O-antigen ligase n=1 Tax=Sphingomonas jinjuensis TaxID=535907 RepID=A0A840FIW0_9SPHN|nr:O-antigen ligase family protein [Sphingomonas jinjuensis]MBB4153898.1 O-antigen ligase [Sphingomonas jinjuensis]